MELGSFDIWVGVSQGWIIIMKKAKHSRSRQYLATVLEDGEQQTKAGIHSKRNSEKTQPIPDFLDRFNHHDSRIVHQNPIYPSPFPNTHGGYRSKLRNTPPSPYKKESSQSISLLSQRLENIHQHYKALIAQQKFKNNQKSQVILGLLDEMQVTHMQKLENMRRHIQDAEQDRKQVGGVDEKMSEIKANIQQLITQSASLKQQNQSLTRKISKLKQRNDERQSQLDLLKDQILETRGQLEQFQIKNIKNNRVNKEISELFKTASSIDEIQ